MAEIRMTHLVAIDQLADRLGTSVRHLRRLVAERRIPFVKLGGWCASTLPRSRSRSGSTFPVTPRCETRICRQPRPGRPAAREQLPSLH